VPSSPAVSESALYLREVAARVARAAMDRLSPAAVLLAGSAADGTADAFSDVDLMLYYDRLPSAEAVAAFRTALEAKPRWNTGQEGEAGWAEGFEAAWAPAVEIQLAHQSIAGWTENLDRLLIRFEPEPLLQKAAAGVLAGVALHGESLIGEWQARLACYPDGLAEAMVRRHLDFFPLWGLAESLGARDALLWARLAQAETLQNVLGVLAGVNRVYFSTFQFKRAGRFIACLRHAPPALAERLDTLLRADPYESAEALRALCSETLDLAAEHMPAVDLTAARARQNRRHLPRPGPTG
jgi:hypothetical protein